MIFTELSPFSITEGTLASSGSISFDEVKTPNYSADISENSNREIVSVSAEEISDVRNYLELEWFYDVSNFQSYQKNHDLCWLKKGEICQ